MHHNKLGRNVVLRDVKLLCGSLGVQSEPESQNDFSNGT